MIQKSLKKNAFLNLIRTFMSLVFPLITFPYTSRVIGPVYIGKVSFSTSIVQYFSLLAGLGIATHATRELSKIRDDYDVFSRKTAEFFRLNLISSFIAYGLFVIALLFVPKFSSYRILLLVCSTTILISPFGMDYVYNAMEEFGYITTRTIFFQILSIVLLFTTVHSPDDYLRYAAINVISSSGSNLLNFFNIRKHISFKYFFKKLDVVQHLKPVFVLFAMVVASKIYTAIDTSMVGFLRDDYEVGIYTVATKINKMVLAIVTAATGMLFPRLSYYLENEGFEKFKELAYKGFSVLFLLSVPCTIGLNLISQNITVLLSGEKYIAAIPVMKIMNPIIVITSLSTFIGSQIFLPMNKEKWTLYSVLIGVVINVMVNFILIPGYGATGAAIGTIISEGCILIVQLILYVKMLSLKPIVKPFFVCLFNSILMAVPVYMVTLFVKNQALNLTISIISGVVVYFAILLIERNSFVMKTIDEIKRKYQKRSIDA